MKNVNLLLSLFLVVFAISCNQQIDNKAEQPDSSVSNIQKSALLLKKYEKVQLTADLSHLSDNQRKMIGVLINVAEIMDELFWKEAFGDKTKLIGSLSDLDTKKFCSINYGPWDRLANNDPFIEGIGAKPKGANFYPVDMTAEEFDQFQDDKKSDPYTMIRRDNNGNLVTVAYHEYFRVEVTKAATLLREAADLAEDESFKNYLTLRAEALLNDEYLPSDMAWMDMKTNTIDMIVGPIETYEDQLYGFKTAHEAYILLKDMEWSEKLSKYAAYLPGLQEGLPVADRYKREVPGSDAQLAAFDVIYYAGDCNAGSKTIAVNLPNDEKVQLEKGTRRSQLKNTMRAKFDKILVPIANVLIDSSQRNFISFDAFFANTMFHEVAHGLGIKNTINGKGTVRKALKEHNSALEEGKADVLGLYMISELHEKGLLENDLEEYYTTFLASIFRSVRFGASSAHGKANMIRFNHFLKAGAFSYNHELGTYKVNFDKMKQAMHALSEKILVFQGDGDYNGVTRFVDEFGIISPSLQSDLDKLTTEGIPVDIVFDQGVEVLGLVE